MTFVFTSKKITCYQISNDVDIFINETISKWQSKLKLNLCVYWTTDFDYYNETHENFTGKPSEKDKVASCLSGINLIFLNKVAHQFSFKELEKSLVHELLHLKYPDKQETWIIKKTNKVLKQ